MPSTSRRNSATGLGRFLLPRHRPATFCCNLTFVGNPQAICPPCKCPVCFQWSPDTSRARAIKYLMHHLTQHQASGAGAGSVVSCSSCRSSSAWALFRLLLGLERTFRDPANKSSRLGTAIAACALHKKGVTQKTKMLGFFHTYARTHPAVRPARLNSSASHSTAQALPLLCEAGLSSLMQFEIRDRDAKQSSE